MADVSQDAERGFTLVELIVTVVLLGILSGIAMLALGSSRKTSVRETCETAAQALSMAVTNYQSDFPDAALPTVGTLLNPTPSPAPSASTTSTVKPYISSSLLNSFQDYFTLAVVPDTSTTDLNDFKIEVSRGLSSLGYAPAACSNPALA